MLSSHANRHYIFPNNKNRSTIKALKYIFIFFSTIVAVLYAASLSLRLDSVQCKIATVISDEIKNALEIPVSIKSLRIKHLDEVILKDIALLDLQGDTIVGAKEIIAHISPHELLKNKIQVNTLAIGAPNISISRDSATSPLNIQFIIDKLKKDDNKESKAFTVRINQLLIYDGEFSYDIHSAPYKQDNMFDPAHIAVNGIQCNISLKKFLKDELDLFVRSIRGQEKSGLELTRLKASVKAQEGYIKLKDMEFGLPHSSIASDSISVIYDKANPKALNVTCNISSQYVTPSDFSALSSKITKEMPTLAFGINSHTDSISSRTTISAKSINEDISLKTIATISTPYDNERKANVYIRQLDLNKEGIVFLQSFLKEQNLDITDKVESLSLAAEAEIKDKEIKGNFVAETNNGNIAAEGAYNNGEFDLSINGYDINICDLAKLKTPLKCSVQAKANGCINDDEKNVCFSSVITELESPKHSFAPIELTGAYDIIESHFNTNIKTEDPGVTARFKIDYNYKNDQKATLSLDVDSINPCMIGLNDKENETFSFELDGEFEQNKNNTGLLNVKLQNITFNNDEGKNIIRNLHFCDSRNDEQRMTILNSDFINCSLIGKFDYSSIINSVYKLTTKHVPSLQTQLDTTVNKDCNYIFKCDIKDSHFVSRLLKLPFVINAPSFINGACNEKNGTLTINTAINEVDIKKSRYKSVGFNGKSTNKALTLESFIIKPSKSSKKTGIEDDLKIDINCTLFNDTIQNKFNWKSNKKEGRIRLDAAIDRDTNDQLFINTYIQPDSIVHNDSVWYISGGGISGNLDKIRINGLSLYNNTQHLLVKGDIGKQQEDTLSIRTNNLEVSSILDLVKFRILQFNGKATGSAHASALLSAPDVSGDFKVDSFKIDNGYLGKADLNIGWRNHDKSIFLNANIHNDQDKISTVNGFLSQANDTIHLEIDADEINAVFINKMVKSFMSDIEGTATGKAYLLGQWRAIDLKGAVSLNCSARVNPTNVRYTFHGDSLYMTSGRLTFNEAFVTDKYGNKGWLSGNVTHSNLGKWACDLSARVNNMLVYDTNNFDQIPFYGTVYATGNANLKANDKGLFLKAEASNGANSRIVYNSSEAASARDNSFVKFIDSSKKPATETTVETIDTKYQNHDSKLNLDFMLDVNEGLQIKVYTNLKSDDYIDLYGKGTVNAVYDEKEGFSLKGNLDLDRGTYKITVQDIFTKEFNITKGSSLLFNGTPYEANLDLKTKHLVPSASLSALTTETTKRKSVKVNCLLDITGTLESPILNFDLELPDGSEEEKEMLASATSTPEQKNMQFIYLLGIGKFYTYDYNNPLATNTQNTTAVESLISNTLSGQLNNMLGQIIDNDNWNISSNISTSERGWNSMEVEGMLEGRLLNDRLLINGNLGYRENPVANSNFIGDFELQWLLNKKGTISLRAYSKTNDRYFSKTNLTTQGAGIILRHDFNTWRWWKKKSKEKEK